MSTSTKVRTGKAGTLLGPMTTAWSVPASCSVHVVNCPTCVNGYQAQHCISGAAQDYSGCWPPVLPQAGTPAYPYLGWGFYSPGVACPTGYTAACTAEYGAEPEWPIQFVLFPGETAVGCCPTGFQCANNDGNTCIARVRTDAKTVAPTGVCSAANIVGVAQANLPVTMTITATATSTGDAKVATNTEAPEFTLWAPMFQINHRASDLESASKSSASSSATTTSQPDLPTTTSTLPESATSSASGSAVAQGGLSTGAIAGIVVGAAAGGILLTVLLGCLWWRRARKRREEEKYPPSPSTATWVGADGAGAGSGGYRTHNPGELPTKTEMYFTTPGEMDVPRAPIELPSEHWSHQLDGRQIETRHG